MIILTTLKILCCGNLLIYHTQEYIFTQFQNFAIVSFCHILQQQYTLRIRTGMHLFMSITLIFKTAVRKISFKPRLPFQFPNHALNYATWNVRIRYTKSLILHVDFHSLSQLPIRHFQTKETIRNIYEQFLSDPILTGVRALHDGKNNPNEVCIFVMKPQ